MLTTANATSGTKPARLHVYGSNLPRAINAMVASMHTMLRGNAAQLRRTSMHSPMMGEELFYWSTRSIESTARDFYKEMSLSRIQDDLTNLNWVAGTPVPINSSVSPPNQSSKPRPHTRTLPTAAVDENAKTSTSSPSSRSTARKPAGSTRSTPRCRSIGRSRRGREDATAGTEGQHKKPNCSYTCLIVMALKASGNGCLPVNEIYKFIE